MLIVIAVLLLLFVLSPVAGIIVVAAALAFETVELLFWRRVLRGRRAVTGVEGMVGESGVVVERCDPAGTVRVRGEIWNARCEGGAGVGEVVRVSGVDGLRLEVERASG